MFAPGVATAQAYVKRTYDAAVELFAHLCKTYNLNPLADGVIISHSEGSSRGQATNHADPEHLWRGLNMAYTMDGFRKDVNKAMNGNILYRVQVGAFAYRSNAEATLTKLKKAGFDGYITIKKG